MSIENKKIIFIISSPSGAGKTTICKKLIKKLNNIDLSVSYTTRSKRKNEINGKDYYFVNKEKFNQLNKNNFFIETAKVFNNFYGSPLNNINKSKNNILFDIDWQGAKKLRKKFDNNRIIDFFILPPSIKELKNRLIKRGRDNNKEINLRLSLALDEMVHYKDYKYILINENINKTVNQLIKIIDYSLLIESNKILLQKKLKNLVKP
tara:strand:+ start:419 stop:1039 length:621 start_codon:yes stop_codon:yes gene_type:complete